MRRTGFVRRRPLRTGIVALSALAVMVLSPAPPGALAAYAEQVLYRFCSQTNCVDGKNPVAAPIMDGGGNLYGTTVSGGANNGGVVFKLTPTATGWTYSVLYSFCSKALCADGGTPNAGLLMDGMGNLYGTTTGGGPNQSTSGVVFKLAPSGSGWTEMVLYSFCAQSNCADGAQPYAGLIMDAAGNLYGTTVGGGNSTSVCTGGPGCGVVFKLAPTSTGWAETVLYRFCSSYPCADGANPAAGLLMDGAGNLYGTTAGGGYGYDAVCGSNHGCGVVFELTPTVTGWKETVIYAFCPPPQSNCTDGANPYAGLTMDGAGNLYGTTANAGFTSGHLGNVFELMPTGTGWSEKFLYLFCSQSGCADGALPHAAVIMDAAGHLFGTTNGETGGIPGTFFKLAFTGTGWMETVLHSFSGADGIGPSSSPLMDAAGNFYGTTYQGGNSNNAGVVFSLAPAGATTLSVSLLGPGTVTSSPSGINCPATCSASFTAGTQVGLSQTPAGGWSFGGWGGACSGIAGCTVTMTSNQSVAAAFWTNGSVVPYPSPAGAPQVSGVPSPPPAAP